MYTKKLKYGRTKGGKLNQSFPGERIEDKVNRMVNNGEPINDGVEIVYARRGDGILKNTDIRTDKFELAIEAHEQITADRLDKRQAFSKKLEEDNKELKGNEPSTDAP